MIVQRVLKKAKIQQALKFDHKRVELIEKLRTKQKQTDVTFTGYLSQPFLFTSNVKTLMGFFLLQIFEWCYRLA